MSRLKFKSILKWVDSHMNDYPTAIINIMKQKSTRINIFAFFVSFCLLFLVSPVLGIFSLLVFSIYLMLKKRYKNLFFFWVSFLFIWYLVFIACLIGYEGSILITPDLFSDEDSESRRLFFYILDKYPYSGSTESFFNFNFGHFCMQTFGLLCWISLNWEVTIYIPSVFKGILGFFKFIRGVWGGKGGPSVECSPKKNSSYESPPSPSTPFPSRENNWGTKPSWKYYSPETDGKEKEFEFDSPTPSPKSAFGISKSQVFDPDVCSELKRRLDKAKSSYNPVGSESSVVKGRYIAYGEFGFLNKWKLSGCINRPASADEIQKEKLFREFERNEK